jgi:hypothetical protein
MYDDLTMQCFQNRLAYFVRVTESLVTESQLAKSLIKDLVIF